MYPCFTSVDQRTYKLCIPDWEHNVVPSTPTYLIKNIVNSPLCLCRSEETNKHLLLHCPRYENQRLSTHFASSWQIHRCWQYQLTFYFLAANTYKLIKTHDFLTLFLSSSVNPNALVINHSYCQVHCLPFFPYYITCFPNIKT